MNFIIIPKEKLDFFETSLFEIKTFLQAEQLVEKSSNWISKKEGARRLNVCDKTFDNYLKKGIIPFTQFKSKIYVKASDIEAHLEKYYVIKN